MGIFDILRGQTIDVIEWVDNTTDTIVHKYDLNGKDIMMGAQLTVRESQVAIFVNEGQIADVYQPGRHELTTSNMPIMTALKSWKFGFNSPFKADVYFVNTKQFMNNKWGTASPVMMRDSEFGMVRLRAFGVYGFKVTDPVTFLKEVFGTNSMFMVSDINEQMKRTLVSGLSDALAESKIPALDIAANYGELGDYTLRAISPKFAPMGITLQTFVIENVSLPEEVEKAMDRRTSMGVVGDLNKYTQFQAAESMRDAANNPGGGVAGMGVGMGAAAMMGQMFTQSMQPGAQAAPAAASAPAQAAGAFCTSCGKPLAPGAKFCPECGAAQGSPACKACGAALTPGAKFCPSCGAKQ